MLAIRNQALLLVLAVCFAAFPWEFVDTQVLAAASQVQCDSDGDHLNHEHGDHSGTEDPCGDDCGCLCCPGHGQFPSTSTVLPGAPVRALAVALPPVDALTRGRSVLNDIFRPPRNI